MFHQGQFIAEIIDKMADLAVQQGGRADQAIENFSAGIDRFVAWLPAALRPRALEHARAHGYSSLAEIERLRQEEHN